MKEEYKHKEQRELIRKFEAFLKNKENHYFEEETFLEVIAYYQNHDKLNMALKACRLALEHFSFSVDLFMETADVLVKLERFDEAIELMYHALMYQPNDPELLMLKGSIHAMTSDYHEAIACYKIAVDSVEDKDEVYYSIGIAYQGLEQYKDASDYYTLAIEHNILNENALYEFY